ncbi:putative two-component system sensor kinase [Actinacidiphila reveromycinica]|uniref:histidine kinase n=1 Tax=Actinacidiphila reveromycinica TaxID=659352 RepID=A0A7U3UN92_9ACTN|nr:HAMP domain-containing sensor histidine kinase [Streptomyces sp. SN-593]BBA95666.1 putative two-component system sensor kinase [Streptomyces sp. SN-593]
MNLLRRAAGRLRHPSLTIRGRLTLTYAALFTVGGSALVMAMTTALYHEIFRPLPASQIPSSLDPDHDNFVGLSDQIRDAAASRLLVIALLLLSVVVALSTLVGWWVAGRLLRPIAEITAAARRATDATLHERLRLTGPADELRELGDTFDEMLERLDRAFGAQRRFVANASHELRTPLALTRAAVEVTLAKPVVTEEQWRTMAADVADSTGSAQRLISALLVLARSERGVTDLVEDDLGDVAAEALDQVAARARKRGLRLEADLASAPLLANVALLGIAVANLLENAVRYNRDGGLLRITTAPAGDGAVRLTVLNDGPALDPDRVENLFEPFNRGDRTRRRSGPHDLPDGTGLGLSIVRAVARAHAGSATARARAEGGLSVALELPAGLGRDA